MVKNKKLELSLDEKLLQSLVPENEQPYQIPANWIWTRLGAITKIIGGGTPLSYVAEYYDGGDIPWLSPVDLSGYSEIYISRGRKNITKVGLQKSSAHLLPKDTVVLSTRAPIGYVAIAANELSTSQGFKNFLPSSAFIPKYLYWYLKYNKELLKSYASGTTFLELSGTKAALIEFPLAPLSEQRRIVERIEDLFVKLDHAKEIVQSVIESLEVRRIAILQKAFTGELTAQWREANGIGMDSWSETALSELCDSFQYGTSKKSNPIGDVVVIRMGNLQSGKIEWNDLAYTTDKQDIEKYLLKPGDVLFNRTNSPELVGKTSIYKGEMPAIFAGYLIRINYRGCLNGDYLNYVMNSQKAKEYCSAVKSDGVNQSNINAKKLAAFTIPYCSLEEQYEIVSILDDIFDKEQATKEYCDDVIKQIDLMKKSIFTRAYCGELDTNDPNEASAEQLLKQLSIDTIDSEPPVITYIAVEEVKKMDMIEALKIDGQMTPEELKRKVELDIDDYYEQLKDLIQKGLVFESRKGKEVYLEAAQ